ncbi:putative aldouronate transport system substrate-binding protein [Gracilibacillus ureilyticus]|uniref:Putative aldouronate transport system substrate-binding protein n=1 Tax=Gracilibacillus ureilyticus TaxID=531814 RepID=A0A1H9R704_9BACI|nr:extracellular solute-binding protein [Gracilibacillus ureilyticus]SER67713.1 putative aldouronate transport system substrate-binding protein [Gracilibacillus ureilyticus]
MDSKKKLWSILAIIFFFVLAACSNEETTVEEDAEENPPTASEPADPFGKYDETITIAIGQEVDPSDTSLQDGDTPLDNQYTRHVKENLNIEVEHAFTASPSNYDQKVSLAIASNDLPDAMVVGPVELRQMVEADQIADLTEIYENYASPAIKEIIDSSGGVALDNVTFDGKIMAIPNSQAGADGVHNLWIRKDWLDKLGLEPPQTVEELKEVARAFVEEDPDGNGEDDTIGLAGPDTSNKLYANFIESTNNLYGFDGIFSALHSYPGYWLEGEDGNPVYGSILPETKEALSVLRDMYSEGLIDAEMGVREDSGESIISGNTGMFFGPFWMPYGPLTDAVKNNPDANWQSYALPLDANGEYTPHLSTTTTQFVVVRKDYEHPEAAMKILNNLLANESEFDPSIGGPGYYPLRLVYAPADEMEVTTVALREVLAGTKQPEDFYDMPAYKLLKSDVDTIFDVKLEPYDNMDIQYWDIENHLGQWTRAYSALVGTAPLVDTEIKGVKSLIYSQTKTMEDRWVNLKKLEDETFLKIIMGTEPLDAFDQFVEDWKQQGGDTITEEVAEAVN